MEIASARQSDAADLAELLDEIRALWNAEGEPDEYYHGVYLWPWLGDDARDARTAGVAELAGNIAVSTIAPPNVIPHEFGHNLDLLHTPGCGAESVDFSYPYPSGELGPVAGWDVNRRRFVSNEDEGYTDVMSYCGRVCVRVRLSLSKGAELPASKSLGDEYVRSAAVYATGQYGAANA